MIEPKKQNPYVAETARFSVQVLSSTAMLSVNRFFITRMGHNSSILYDKYCLSSYDPILCGSHYLSKEIANVFNASINKVGGVFMMALILTATAKATGMLYRKFTKIRGIVYYTDVKSEIKRNAKS